MLQSKGLSSRAAEEDHEQMRRLADAEMTIHQLEGLLEQKDKEMLQLREVWICLCVCVCVFRNKNETKCIQAFHCMGVSLCEARCEYVQISFIWKTLWLASLIAHNLDLIKKRNPSTYTNTQEGTLYPVGFAFILVCIFLKQLNTLAFYTTAPSSGISNEQLINVKVLEFKINWNALF